MLGAITLGITGCLGALTGGVLADRWGKRPVVIASRIGLMIVSFPVMKFLVANPSSTTLVLAITILSRLHAAGAALRGRRGLRDHVAGPRNRQSAGFDLLRDRGECPGRQCGVGRVDQYQARRGANGADAATEVRRVDGDDVVGD